MKNLMTTIATKNAMMEATIVIDIGAPPLGSRISLNSW